MGLERRQSGLRNACCTVRGQDATFPQRRRGLQGPGRDRFPSECTVPSGPRLIRGLLRSTWDGRLELRCPEEQSCLSSDHPQPGAWWPFSFPAEPISSHLTQVLIGPLPRARRTHAAAVAGNTDKQTRAHPQGTCNLSGGNDRNNGHRHHRSVHSPCISPALACAKPHIKHVTCMS